MIKKIKFLCIILILFSLSSCKKEEEPVIEASKAEPREEITWIEKTEDGDIEHTIVPNRVEVVDIELNGSYEDENIRLGYIPKGYKLIGRYSTEEDVILELENDGQILLVSIYPVTDNMMIDTENAVLEELWINGEEALFSGKESNNILVWSNGEKTFFLSGKVPQEEMIKIGENIQTLKK